MNRKLLNVVAAIMLTAVCIARPESVSAALLAQRNLLCERGCDAGQEIVRDAPFLAHA